MLLHEQTVGQRIKMTREYRNLTQTQVADLLGIKYQYISGIERGVKHPSYRMICKIAKVLDCDPVWLQLGTKETDVNSPYQPKSVSSGFYYYSFAGMISYVLAISMCCGMKYSELYDYLSVTPDTLDRLMSGELPITGEIADKVRALVLDNKLDSKNHFSGVQSLGRLMECVDFQNRIRKMKNALKTDLLKFGYNESDSHGPILVPNRLDALFVNDSFLYIDALFIDHYYSNQEEMNASPKNMYSAPTGTDIACLPNELINYKINQLGLLKSPEFRLLLVTQYDVLLRRYQEIVHALVKEQPSLRDRIVLAKYMEYNGSISYHSDETFPNTADGQYDFSAYGRDAEAKE